MGRVFLSTVKTWYTVIDLTRNMFFVGWYAHPAYSDCLLAIDVPYSWSLIVKFLFWESSPRRLSRTSERMAEVVPSVPMSRLRRKTWVVFFFMMFNTKINSTISSIFTSEQHWVGDHFFVRLTWRCSRVTTTYFKPTRWWRKFCSALTTARVLIS